MKSAKRREWLQFATIALASAACGRKDDADRPRPAQASAAAPAPAALDPWEPVDEAFRGCQQACGTRVAGGSADIVVQPGAQPGQRTYCLVSGAVFTVTDASPREEIGGRPVYLCCAGCARFFTANRDRVVASRRLGAGGPG